MRTRLFGFLVFLLILSPIAVRAQDVAPALTVEAVNGADLHAIAAETAGDQPADKPDPAIVRLQVLLDRAGASPGVIDGFDGDNFRKAITAFETMQGLRADGQVSDALLSRLPAADFVVGFYTIVEGDVSAIVAPLPTDYAELAKRDFLGYASVPEELGERFHMDEDLLKALNPSVQWQVGDRVAVADFGTLKQGEVARLEADKQARQLRGYDASGKLLVAYPATIGSTDNPSPSGVHVVEAVAPMPNYTYNPDNFQQGDNTEKLILPPGPNGPVGSMWIDLSEPTYGIHGTPEPSKIDKTNSHGCVRLTNWDAEELAKLVKPGVKVEFLG